MNFWMTGLKTLILKAKRRVSAMLLRIKMTIEVSGRFWTQARLKTVYTLETSTLILMIPRNNSFRRCSGMVKSRLVSKVRISKLAKVNCTILEMEENALKEIKIRYLKTLQNTSIRKNLICLLNELLRTLIH